MATSPKNLLLAESPSMQSVVAAVEEAAQSDDPVLIEGEPGTGRELVARVIHLSGSRKLGAFITLKGGEVPVAAFADLDAPASATPSALQRASGGTLLVKDLCALPKKSQERLEKNLQAKSSEDSGEFFDVRLVATTDPDLSVAVSAGVFRESLYQEYKRRIVIPPLRERTLDIAPLAGKLIRAYGRTMGRSRIRVSTRAYDRMVSYQWPGNVAELKAVCRRLAVLARDGKVDVSSVDSVLPNALERTPLESLSFEEMVRAKLSEFLRRMEDYPLEGLHEDVISRVERPLFELVLARTGQNQVKAAEILGVSRNTLRRKLAELGVRPQPKAARRRPRARKPEKKTG